MAPRLSPGRGQGPGTPGPAGRTASSAYVTICGSVSGASLPPHLPAPAAARRAAGLTGAPDCAAPPAALSASRPMTMSRPYQPARPRPRRTRRHGSGHDQQASLVVHVGASGLQASLADPEVVTAQQQVNRVRSASGRRHHHGNHRPCRAAACPRSNVQRYGSLQLHNELLARGGRPVRPPPLHTLTIALAWMGRQGRCSRAAWSWVLSQLTLPHGPA